MDSQSPFSWLIGVVTTWFCLLVASLGVTCSVQSSPLLFLSQDLPSIPQSSHAASGSPLAKSEHSLSAYGQSPDRLDRTMEGVFSICTPPSHYECNLSTHRLPHRLPQQCWNGWRQYFTTCLKLPTEMKEAYDCIRIKDVWYYCHGWGFFSWQNYFHWKRKI